MPVFIGVVVLLAFSRQCIDAAIFNRPVCERLRAFSLLMFLCNSFVEKNFRCFCSEKVPNFTLFVMHIGIVAILSFVMYEMYSFIKTHM